MAYVERQKEINLHKKNLDFYDVKKKAKEFQHQVKMKQRAKRSLVTDT